MNTSCIVMMGGVLISCLLPADLLVIQISHTYTKRSQQQSEIKCMKLLGGVGGECEEEMKLLLWHSK